MRAVCIPAVATLVVILVASGCGGAAKEPDDDLATIQLGHRPENGDKSLALVTERLDILEQRCNNSRSRLADFTANVVKTVVADTDYHLTPLEVLQDAVRLSNVYAPAGTPKVNCLTMFSQLASLYEDGKT